MEIRKGYKRTKVGIIPEDWETKPLGEEINVFRGGSPRPIQAFITTDQNGVNWIKIGDVRVEAKYIDNTEEKIKLEGVSHSRTVKVGDLLLSNSMSFGRPYILLINGCIHDGWLVLQDYQKSFIKDFLYYILSSKLVINQYISKAAGSSVLNLNREIVSSVVLPIPPLHEQRAIATALSDIDDLISSLTKLIDKKKNIKQGAMQELLTGKKRLEGFSGEWKSTRLGEHLRLQVGYPFKSIFFNQSRIGIRLIKNGDLKNDDQIYFFSGEYLDEYLVTNGDVLIGMDGEFVPCLWKKGVALLNQRVGRVLVDKHFDLLFIRYVLVSPLTEIQRGTSATTVKHLSHKNIENLVLNIPQFKKEQTAIANILSDMDAEIEALERKLNKYKSIKQGMMQELLTGRIRLV